jgi:hypothetical protein
VYPPEITSRFEKFFKFDEIFTVDRACFADHFGRKSLIFAFIFPAKHAKYFSFFLPFFRKKFFSFLKNLIMRYDNLLKS